MAKLKSGILGGISGTIGNVVGSSWNGIDVLKTLPASYTDAGTAAQLDQRSKFMVTLAFLKPLTSIVRIGFANYAVKMTAFNAAFSEIIKNAITGTTPNFLIDYTKAKLTRGNLENAPDCSAASATAGTVTLTWDPALSGYLAKDTDNVMAVIYNPTKGSIAQSINLATRVAGTLDVTVPSTWSGDTVHAYLSFVAASALYSQPDRNEIATSLYGGSVIVS